MADYSPVFSAGLIPFTATTSATVVGGNVVAVSATGTVGPAGVGAVFIGVAAHDAASGAAVTVWPLNNVVHELVVVAAATITAGDGVVTAAAGTVNTATIATAAAAGTLLGIAMTTATAGNLVQVMGRN